MSTRSEALRWAREQLRAAGVEALEGDARILLCHAAGISRADLALHPEATPSADALARFEALVLRRVTREPVARILGVRAFHVLELEVTPATLDPRPDTESIVDVGLSLVQASVGPIRILDLGTGTGAIALALLKALPKAEGVATDVSEAALEVARRNAQRTGLVGRVRFIQSDWFGAVEGRFNLIVSNPPYIPTADIAALEPEVRSFDPIGALDGGTDGLDAYRAIARSASAHLADGGWLILEVGHDQADRVSRLMQAAGLHCVGNAAPAQWDLGGHRRCVVATTSPGMSKKSLGFGSHSV